MQKKKFPHLFAALLFPAFFIYYEILFRVTTVRGLFQIGTVFTILFCCAYGMVGYLLCTLTNNRKANHIVSVCLRFITTIPFLVEYFIF